MSRQPRAGFDPRRARRRILFWSAGLFAGVALAVLLAIQWFGYQEVRESWDAMSPWVTVVKWAGLGILVSRWREFVHWAARRWNMSDAYRDYLAGMRWRVAAGLLALELLLVQNLPGRILA